MKSLDTIIIGAGPVGLYAATKLEERKENYLLLESESYVGGQIPRLYPKKLVVDVPMFGECEAIEIIEKLTSKIDEKKIHLSEKALSITHENQKIAVKTQLDSYFASKVIIATGLGESEPRPLGVEGEKECAEILYDLKDPLSLKGKKVAVFGGGDSALDWSRDLSKVASKVYLIHRRTEFRGNANTINGCDVTTFLPYVPKSILVEGDKLKSVTIENVNDHSLETLKVDYVLVNYGQIPVPSTFGYPLSKDGFGIAPNNEYEIDDGIFVAGDVCFDASRKKRMMPGFEEIDIILDSKSYKDR